MGVVLKVRGESNGNLLRLWVLSAKRTTVMKGPLETVEAHNGEVSPTLVGAAASGLAESDETSDSTASDGGRF